METLTSAQRRALRARAHALHPVVSIGQHGLTPAVLHEIDVALIAHELIKIRVWNDDRAARDALYEHICAELGAAPVQHIGKLLVLWRPAPEPAPAPAAPSPGDRRKSGAARHAARPGRGQDAPAAGAPKYAARAPRGKAAPAAGTARAPRTKRAPGADPARRRSGAGPAAAPQGRAKPGTPASRPPRRRRAP